MTARLLLPAVRQPMALGDWRTGGPRATGHRRGRVTAVRCPRLCRPDMRGLFAGVAR